MGKFVDLTGQRFGKLLVIERVEPHAKRENTHSYWKCRCDCGNEKRIDGTKLTSGRTKSCGCLKNKNGIDRYNFVDLVGQKFGKLKVLEMAQIKDKRIYWLCECDCGNKKVVLGSSLKSKRTTSCGCKKMESRKGEETLINRIYLTYKNHAKKRNKDFCLDKDFFWSLTQLPCYYCGAEKTNTAKNYYLEDSIQYNGIDRIDSALGYTIDNVVPCCIECNQAKNDLSQSYFKSWIEKVYNNFVKLR